MPLRHRKPRPPRRDDGIPFQRGGGNEHAAVVRPSGLPDCEQAECNRELRHQGAHYNIQRDAWFGRTTDGEWMVFVRDGAVAAGRAD